MFSKKLFYCIKYFLSTCLFLLLYKSKITGQELRVGDSLPSRLWSVELTAINHHKNTVTLSDYKDKLIIIDFWATWCTPCIRSLHKLDSLQKNFGQALAVIPVTYEKKSEAFSKFNKYGWRLHSIVEDTVLKKYFPHYLIPHQVWIKNGKVLSITGAEYSNLENISKVLHHKPMRMIQKKDANVVDMSKDSLNFPYFKSLLSSRIRNAKSGITRAQNEIRAYNVSLKDLLIESYVGLFSLGQLNAMLIWDVSDSLKNELTAKGKVLRGDYEHDMLIEEWLDRNLYCYTLSFDKSLQVSSVQIKEIMRNDIIRFIRHLKGVDCSLTRKSVEHWVLVKTESLGGDIVEHSVSSDHIIKVENRPVREFLLQFSYLMEKPIIADDEIKENVSLEVDLSSRNIDTIRKQLHSYGFDLVSKMIEKEVIIFEPIK